MRNTAVDLLVRDQVDFLEKSIKTNEDALAKLKDELAELRVFLDEPNGMRPVGPWREVSPTWWERTTDNGLVVANVTCQSGCAYAWHCIGDDGYSTDRRHAMVRADAHLKSQGYTIE